MLAVFERINLDVLAQLLWSAARSESLPFVEFRNQLGAPRSVPDASIRGSFHFLFEVKTARNSLSAGQLRRHSESLDKKAKLRQLFVLTPDWSEPVAVLESGVKTVKWFNFVHLSRSIDVLLADESQLVSDQERFLLRELQSLFVADGLVSPDDVVVVAARNAYGEYARFGAYVCQPGRTFRSGISRVGFYADGEVKPEVPTIIGWRDGCRFDSRSAARLTSSPREVDRKIGALIRAMLTSGARQSGTTLQVFLLSAPDDGVLTLRLARPVSRDAAHDGWIQKQQYTRSAWLARAQTLADLRAPASEEV